ncbi:MAG: hypothetical protein AAF938_06990 [Myxococcota bacterium]
MVRTLVLSALVIPLAVRAHAQSREAAEPPLETGAATAETRAEASPEPSALERAVQCLAQGNLRCARAELAELMDTDPSAEVAYYQAVAFRLAGDSLSATRVLTRMLEGEFGTVNDARRARMAALRDEVQAELASVRITSVGGPERANVSVNGAAIDEWNGQPLDLELNAGRQIVALSAPAFISVRRVLELGVGERVDVRFVLEPVETRPLRRRASFWIILVGSALVVGALTAGVVIARRTERDRTFDGPFGPGSEEI